jgi:hypothetical protein
VGDMHTGRGYMNAATVLKSTVKLCTTTVVDTVHSG